MQFLRIGPLDLPAAEGAGDRPAGPARVPAAMGTIQLLIGGYRAYAEFLCFVPALLPSALFMFPAIKFHKAPLEICFRFLMLFIASALPELKSLILLEMLDMLSRTVGQTALSSG
jgi:hypothetical protein